MTFNPGVEAAHAAELNEARAGLQQIVARVADSPANWSVAAAYGDPAAHILQMIEHQGIDLVVMTTHGRGALGRALFGSVADRIVRAAPVPVLLIRPDVAAPEKMNIRRLLVPLDGSELAEAALPAASALAKRLEVPVHLVRATNSMATLATLSGSTPFPVNPPADVYERLASDLDNSARAYLADVATRLRGEGIEVSVEVRDGSPYTEILDAVHPGDVLVMTSHGRGGVMRWLLGSVAEKLVREAPAPILLVPSAERGAANAGG
jgi:nucleotide-binding universal stress UspA family protein